MCICMYNIRRVYIYIYYLYTRTHTHTHTHKSLKRILMFSPGFKGHALFQNYIQHHYDRPSATLTLNVMRIMILNYTVILNSE